jgi:2-oxo-4-hydroxy-4-carboxy-5-ureidoimidazoline decarboxylase
MDSWRRVDEASPEEARRLLATCCGSTRWIEGMMARRPFESTESLLAAARDVWNALTPDDWREAFRHHPKIGERTSLESRFAATRHLSSREQAGVAGASPGVLDALADANRAYEARFGYIFIVCATGKTAEEMLDNVRARLENDPVVEIHVAAEEQARITALRLEALGR